jgi:hypothetical protein
MLIILKVSCVFQMIWKIPKELMKRVSQAQFPSTLRLAVAVVNRMGL